MRFTIDAEVTVEASFTDLPGLLKDVRNGDLESMLNRVKIVDTEFDLRR